MELTKQINIDNIEAREELESFLKSDRKSEWVELWNKKGPLSLLELKINDYVNYNLDFNQIKQSFIPIKRKNS